jgi:hypothetical protein
LGALGITHLESHDAGIVGAVLTGENNPRKNPNAQLPAAMRPWSDRMTATGRTQRSSGCGATDIQSDFKADV